MEKQRAKHARAMVVGLLVSLWQLGSPRSAAAHGSDRLLREQDHAIGDLLLTVWTSPSRWRPGEVHVDVQVSGADGALTTAPFVQVQITPLGKTRTPQRAIAHPLPLTNLESNPATHEARFRIEQSGDYEVTVSVTDQQGADQQGHSGGVSFEVAVTPVPPAVRLTLHTLLVASLLVALWLVRQGLSMQTGTIHLQAKHKQ